MSSSREVRKVVLVMTVGLCDALIEEALPFEDAAHILFSPHTMRLFYADREVRKIMHLATELDSIARLVPGAFDNAVADVKKRALAALRRAGPCDSQQAHWLSRFALYLHRPKTKGTARKPKGRREVTRRMVRNGATEV